MTDAHGGRSAEKRGRLLAGMEYEVVDVFADGPLEGNPLTVFPDAAGMDGALMQALARETNHSETTFVTGRDGDAWTVRIFTPVAELPFAGHPTLGTADVLRRRHGLGDVTLALGVGPITVHAEGDVLWMRQRAPRFGPAMASAEMARFVGVEVVAAQIVDTGIPFWVVELPDLDALARSHLDQPALSAVSDCDEAILFVRTDGGVQCRMYAPGLGVPEDPATGSANGCLAAYLAQQGPIDLVSRQGIEMQRPSRLFLRAEGAHVEVGGRVVPVASGRFLV